MYELVFTQILNAPLTKVFPFFEKPENLEELTPSNLGFKIKTAKPLEMKKGANFDYTIRLGLIKFPWKTIITDYEPPFRFVDEQKSGPYKVWIHTHDFYDFGDKTKIIDIVHYDLYIKPLKKIINKLYVSDEIIKIFKYRREVLKKMFN